MRDGNAALVRHTAGPGFAVAAEHVVAVSFAVREARVAAVCVARIAEAVLSAAETRIAGLERAAPRALAVEARLVLVLAFLLVFRDLRALEQQGLGPLHAGPGQVLGLEPLAAVRDDPGLDVHVEGKRADEQGEQGDDP